MQTKRKAFLTIVLVLVTIVAVALVTALDQPAYAKGVVKSSAKKSSSEKKSSPKSSSKGKSSASNSKGSRSQPRISASPRSSVRSEVKRPEPIKRGLKDRPSRDLLRRAAPTAARPETRRPSSLYRKDYAEIGEIWRSRSSKGKSSASNSKGSRTQPRISASPRSSVRSEIKRPKPIKRDLKDRPSRDLLRRAAPTAARPETRRPSSLYRKDYAEIGEIWRSRSEKRESSSDKWRENYRRHDRRYYDRDRDWDVHVRLYYPFRYRYYRYDYRPAYSFPSLYCYYYSYFPPYIYAHRVVVVTRFHHPRVFIEIPIIISRDHDYYLADRVQRSLTLALRDIRYAWERSEPDLIMDHVGQDSRIAVYLEGEYAYSVDWRDYHEMTRDAMGVIRTKSFEFDRVRKRETGEYVAYGKHSYYDEDGHTKTVYVSYTLERYDNEWYIIEVGSSPHRL